METAINCRCICYAYAYAIVHRIHKTITALCVALRDKNFYGDFSMFVTLLYLQNKFTEHRSSADSEATWTFQS